MNNRRELNKRFLVFSSLFQLGNQLETIGSQYIEDCTFKQWYFMLILCNLFEKAPTLSECAHALGSSHQNAKQIALKLEAKGYLKIEKDRSDSRSLRLKPTRKYLKVCEERLESERYFISELFKGLTLEEIEAMNNGFFKMEENLKRMEEEKIVNKQKDDLF